MANIIDDTFAQILNSPEFKELRPSTAENDIARIEPSYMKGGAVTQAVESEGLPVNTILNEYGVIYGQILSVEKRITRLEGAIEELNLRLKAVLEAPNRDEVKRIFTAITKTS